MRFCKSLARFYPMRVNESGGASRLKNPERISFIDKTPHPNAVKLFVNWLLSREGQIEFQKRDGSDSFRIDIPKQNVSRENRRIEGADYFEGDDPKFSDRRPADKLLNEIFVQTGK